MFDSFSNKIQHLQCKKKKVLLGYLKVLLRIRKSIQLPLLGKKRRKLFAIDFSIELLIFYTGRLRVRKNKYLKNEHINPQVSAIKTPELVALNLLNIF